MHCLTSLSQRMYLQISPVCFFMKFNIITIYSRNMKIECKNNTLFILKNDALVYPKFLIYFIEGSIIVWKYWPFP